MRNYYVFYYWYILDGHNNKREKHNIHILTIWPFVCATQALTLEFFKKAQFDPSTNDRFLVYKLKWSAALIKAKTENKCKQQQQQLCNTICWRRAGHAAASSCQLYPDKKARKKTQKQKIKNKYKNATERGEERNKANEIPQATKL